MKNGQYLYNKYTIPYLIGILTLLVSSCTSTSSQKTYQQNPKYQQIISTAKAQIGKPYRYGGTSPKTGFDCSGLINFSYKKAGLTVPRTTTQLYKTSSPVKKKHLKRGDLVFFRINRRTISHVGLYLGNGKFVHAPSSGKRVNIANMNDKYWRHRFSRGGRI